MSTWTIAYRKRTANRFERVSEFVGTESEARELGSRAAEAHPEFQVWTVPTAAAETAGEVVAEDIANVLVDSGKRVRITETGTLDALGIDATAPDLPAATGTESAELAEWESELSEVPERCPVCGQFIDYCQGHGSLGDPEGAEILANHDAGEHTACHPEGCEESAAIEAATDQAGHVDYPHTPGYLVDCVGCENGPCVCSDPCTDADCVASGLHPAGARWQHLAPCMSDECEHPDSQVDSGESYCDAHGHEMDTTGIVCVRTDCEFRAPTVVFYSATRDTANPTGDEHSAMCHHSAALRETDFDTARGMLADYMRTEARELDGVQAQQNDRAERFGEPHGEQWATERAAAIRDAASKVDQWTDGQFTGGSRDESTASYSRLSIVAGGLVFAMVRNILRA